MKLQTSLLFCLLAFSAQAQTPFAPELLKLQQKLQTYSPEETDLTPAMQQEMRQMKTHLLAAIEAALQVPGRTPAETRAALLRDLEPLQEKPGTNPNDFWGFGLLSDLTLEHPDGKPDWLAATTTLSIPCGSDTSLYLFRKQADRWVLTLAQVAEDYPRITGAHFNPEVKLIWTQTDAPVVVFVDMNAWCSSNWQTLRYRALRPGQDPFRPQVLGHGEHSYFMSRPWSLQTQPDGFLLRFDTGSMDSLRLVREKVLHFRIENDRLVRISPWSASALAFVDEWAEWDWTEAQRWTEPAAQEALLPWHQRLRDPQRKESTEFDSLRRCPGSPTSWQLTLNLQRYDLENAPEEHVTFRIAQRGQDYWLTGLASKPSPDCTEENPDAAPPN